MGALSESERRRRPRWAGVVGLALGWVPLAGAAAEYALPAARQGAWVAGVDVGVPGGIAQYRPGGVQERTVVRDVTQAPYNADNTGATNAAAAIQAAIADAAEGEVVYLPAGIYKTTTQLTLINKKGVTLRGAGVAQTTIRPEGSHTALFVGIGDDYTWTRPNAPIAAGLARGGGTVLLPDTTGFTVGSLVKLTVEDHIPSPIGVNDVLVVRTNLAPGRNRSQMSRVVAVDPGVSVTIDPPAHFDMPAAITPRISYGGDFYVSTSTKADLVGVESLSIDFSQSTAGYAIWMDQCHACWLYDVHVSEVPNRHVFVNNSVRCEIRRCSFDGRSLTGPNGAGVLWEGSSCGLVEDNIIKQVSAHIQVNLGSSGNVFAYNFLSDSTLVGEYGPSITGNHGPHNSFNLYEGNIAPNYQSDGYYGSSSESTLFRNWFHGDNPTRPPRYVVSLNRFCRMYSMVGNVIGRPTRAAPGLGLVQLGYPNIGNSYSVGFAEPSVGDWWVDYGTVTGPGGYQELDRDVGKSTERRHNHLVSDAGGGIDPAEDIRPDTLPDSLCHPAKPAWFGPLAWPPIDPENPVYDFSAIPAGYRFVHGSDPPPAP